MCKKCEQSGEAELGLGHFDSVHEVEDPEVRRQVVKLLGGRPFAADWPEAAAVNGPASGDKTAERHIIGTAETVTIRTKRHSPVDRRFAFESPDTFGGKRSLLSGSELGEVGGIRHFTETNTKILELVSHNNLVLTERLKVSLYLNNFYYHSLKTNALLNKKKINSQPKSYLLLTLDTLM